MPYADPDKQRQAKRESARRRRERDRIAAMDPRAAYVAELRRDAAAGDVIAEIVLEARFGIYVNAEG